MIKPYFASVPNPFPAPERFTHFEIQTVRDFTDPHGEPYTQPVHDIEDCTDDTPEATGEVYFGVYGRLREGHVEHLFDRRTLAEALATLKLLGIVPCPDCHGSGYDTAHHWPDG